MLLTKLTLENWGCHEHLSADLTGGLKIEGRNGTGKSTVLEAIRFIFADSARGYNKRIRNGTRQAEVQLSFEADGSEWTVEKRISLDKPSQATMIKDGVSIADNPSSVFERLQPVISEEIVDKLLYIPQGGLTSILDRLSGKEGKREMDRLFGIERLERVWEMAGGDIKEQEGRVKALMEQSAKHPDDAPGCYEEEIRAITTRIEDAKREVTALKAEVDRKKGALVAADTGLKALRESKARIDELRKRAAELDIRIAEANKEAQAERKRLYEISEKRERLSAMKKDVEGLKKYGELRDSAAELAKVDAGLAELEGLRSKKAELAVLSSQISSGNALAESHKTLKVRTEDIRARLAHVLARLKQKAEYYKQLTDLSGEAKCPRCGQGISAYNLEKETAEAALSISELEKERVSLTEEEDTLTESLKAADAEMEAYARSDAKARQLEADIKDMQERAMGLLAKRQAIKESLSGLGGKEIDEGYSRLKSLEGSIGGLEADIRGEAALRERIADLDAGACGMKAERQGFAGELEGIGFDADELSKKEIERDEAQKSLYEGRNRLDSLQASRRRDEERLVDANGKLADLRQVAASIEDSKKRLNLLRQAREIFHRDKGLAKYLRESYVDSLNVALTAYFKRFNENPRYSDVSFDRDYNITFKTTEGNLDSSQISGGERVQLALALRIALIDLMSPIRLLILDEPFGSLDETHREMLGESLDRISGQGQLIIVTHVPVDSLRLSSRLDLGGY